MPPNEANTVPVTPPATGQSYSAANAGQNYGINPNAAPGTVYNGSPTAPTTPTNPTNQPVDPITGAATGYGNAPSGVPYGGPGSNDPNPAGFGPVAPNGDQLSSGGAYNDALNQAQSEISATESYYQTLLNQDTTENQQDTSATNAELLASGIAGSGTAINTQGNTTENNNNRTAATQAQLTQALAGIYDQVAQNATAIQNAAQTSAQDAITAQNNVKTSAISSAQNFGKTGLTGAMVQAQDPAVWSQLLQQTGYTPLQLANTINAALPAAANLQQQTVAAPSQTGNGTMITVVTSSINPLTGATVQTPTTYDLAIPYADYNPKALITADDGTPIYIDQNGNAINAETGQKYVPTTTLSQGQVLSNKTTGAVIGQGQPSTTVVPLTSATVNSGPAAGSSSGTSSGTGTGASNALIIGGGPNGGAAGGIGGGSSAPSGNYANGTVVGSNGQATWDSLAALPGNISSQLSLLKADYASPQAAYAAGMQWILNGGSTSSSGSSSSGGGRGAVSGALSDSSSAVGAAILESYGLGPQDADAISGLSTGLNSSLQTMTENQQGTQQFMTKAGTQIGILDNAISKYGDNSNSPLLNVATQAFQNNVTSDPALQSFQVSLQSFLSDYSRITTNSTGSSAAPTDAANTTAQNKLNTLMSQGSLSSAIGTMAQEMNAVMSSYNTQVSSITQDIHNLIGNYATSINDASGASDLGESGSTTSEAAPQSPAGTTQMTGPDGNVYNVPNAQVQAFTAAGGKKP